MTPSLPDTKIGVTHTGQSNNHLMVYYKEWILLEKNTFSADRYGWSNPYDPGFLPDAFSFVVYKP